MPDLPPVEDRPLDSQMLRVLRNHALRDAEAIGGQWTRDELLLLAILRELMAQAREGVMS